MQSKKIGDSFEYTNYNIIFNITDFRVKKMKVLDNQQHIILYMKSQNESDINKKKYSRFALVDLENEIEGKVLASLNGLINLQQIATNFDGSVVLSFSEKTKNFNLHFLENIGAKLTNKKKYVFRKVSFNEKELIQGNLTTITFLYRRKLVVLTDDKGFMYLCTFNFVSQSLELKKCPKIINKEKSEIFKNDFVIKCLTNWDQKFLICVTSQCRICFFEVDSNEAITNRGDFYLYGPVLDLKLSLKGNLLVSTGIYIDSICFWDLRDLDETSFGYYCFNFESACFENSRYTLKKSQKESPLERILEYKYGNLVQYMKNSMKKQNKIIENLEENRKKIFSHTLKLRKKQLNDEDRFNMSESFDIFDHTSSEDSDYNRF